MPTPPSRDHLAELLFKLRHHTWESEEEAVQIFKEIDDALLYYDSVRGMFTIRDPSNTVRLPQTVEEAQAMVRVGAAYLGDRLKALLNVTTALPPVQQKDHYAGPERRDPNRHRRIQD